MNGWLYIGMGIICVLSGNILVKFSHGFEKMALGVTALLFLLVCNICFGMAVKTLPLGIAYVVWMGFVSVGIVMASRFIFQEHFNNTAILLMFVIITCSIGLIYVTKQSS